MSQQREGPIVLIEGGAIADPLPAPKDGDPFGEARWAAEIVESSFDAIIAIKLDGTVFRWNPAASRLFGVQIAAIGQPIEAMVAASFAAHRLRIIAEAREGRSIANTSVAVKTHDGRAIHVAFVSSPLRSATDEIIGAAIIARDVTNQLYTQELCELAVEHSPVGKVLINKEGTILLVNKELERQLGWSREDLVGQSVDVLLPEAAQARHGTLRAGYLARPALRTMAEDRDLFARRKDGSPLPVRIGLGPILYDDGLYVLATVIDISEQLAARRSVEARTKELERSNADLRQFAHIASHDLKEPVRMVASYAQLLADRYRGQLDEKAERYFGYVVEGATRMQRLVEDILAYSQLGTEDNVHEVVDLAVVIAATVEGLQHQLADAGGSVDVGPLLKVSGNPVQLVRLFQNLIGNALKFRAERAPLIRVRARQVGYNCHVEVSDNGIGFSDADGQKIFEMFRRLNSRAAFEGSGLGLAIAKRIVDQHGGAISARGVPGEGAMFEIVLPIAIATVPPGPFEDRF